MTAQGHPPKCRGKGGDTRRGHLPILVEVERSLDGGPLLLRLVCRARILQRRWDLKVRCGENSILVAIKSREETLEIL